MDNCDVCDKIDSELMCLTPSEKYATNGPDVLLISASISNCVEDTTLVYIEQDESTGNYYCPMCSDSEFFDYETLACTLCLNRTPGCSQCDVDGICTVCEEGMNLNTTHMGDTYCHIPNIPYCAKASDKDHNLCQECYGYLNSYPDIFAIAPLAQLSADKTTCVPCNYHVDGCSQCQLNH